MILKQFSQSYNKMFQGSGFFETQCIYLAICKRLFIQTLQTWRGV